MTISKGQIALNAIDKLCCCCFSNQHIKGALWLSGKVLDSRLRGSGFEPNQRHCIVSLGKT